MTTMLEKFMGDCRKLQPEEQLVQVHFRVNAWIRYVDETIARRLHIETPEKTIELGEGSCADKVALKLWALHALGWPIEILQPAYVWDEENGRDAAHMVLVVAGAFILDSNRVEITTIWQWDGQTPHYKVMLPRPGTTDPAVEVLIRKDWSLVGMTRSPDIKPWDDHIRRKANEEAA